MSNHRTLVPLLEVKNVSYIVAVGFMAGYGLRQATWRHSTPGLQLPRFVVLALCGGVIALSKLSSNEAGGFIESPLKTLLPRLTEDELRRLPLQPDALPGARNVSSPYGDLRVYEWGPLDGPKVLFVHGISTPCIALGDVARGLVERGCRVMLFDLWGRGYSDSPNDLPQDARLFTTAILIALASSVQSWMGSSSFTLVGYSLGGGIAANFASFFPNVVNGLVLIAPSGIVRQVHISNRNKFLYFSRILPERLLRYLIKERLQAQQPAAKSVAHTEIASPEDVVEAENSYRSNPQQGRSMMESPDAAKYSVDDVVTWQIQHHQGFVKAFISSIRHGPIHCEQERWRMLGEIIHSQRHQENPSRAIQAFKRKHTLIICGENDPLIVQHEMFEDAGTLLGMENVQLQSFDAGHEVPITHSKDVAQSIWQFMSQP